MPNMHHPKHNKTMKKKTAPTMAKKKAAPKKPKNKGY